MATVTLSGVTTNGTSSARAGGSETASAAIRARACLMRPGRYHGYTRAHEADPPRARPRHALGRGPRRPRFRHRVRPEPLSHGAVQAGDEAAVVGRPRARGEVA